MGAATRLLRGPDEDILIDGALAANRAAGVSQYTGPIMEPKSAPTNVLTTHGVVLARDGRPIARLPDMEVAPGKSVAIVGPSGCGKTTALLALAGVRAPHAGTIMIDGVDPWTLGSHARDRFRGRRIGLVFQSFHLVDALSVTANIRLAAQCAGHPLHEPGRLDELIERLSLTQVRSQRADRISHGQAQRVAVARALLNRPAVVLADEPTSALDDAHTADLMKLLTQSASAEHAALVMATHDRRVLGTVDRVVEMEAMQ
jgi:putative ABC transport system ATP-binding protein